MFITLINPLRQKTERVVIYLLSTYKIKQMPLLRIVGENDLFLSIAATTGKRILGKQAACGGAWFQ